MSRRTKNDIEKMREICTEYLNKNNNEPHAAYEDMIKEHLISVKSIPSCIRGVKDFIKVSKELKAVL
ncbi:hypothetical protein J2S74_002933 [Evansella vedderi]|uniref:Uncharacterized protein n=1 Tax=Evansella vedderi TaxID=38282 RepID=A0ABT9ZXX9_9BACI|nr:hypothetical protein [Evansella vedderi]MDQ0255551.1 hypothetical protein [Evansella vedderi]